MCGILKVPKGFRKFLMEFPEDYRIGCCDWMAWMWSAHETTPFIHNASVTWHGNIGVKHPKTCTCYEDTRLRVQIITSILNSTIKQLKRRSYVIVCKIRFCFALIAFAHLF